MIRCTLFSILSYMNLHPGSGRELMICKEHLLIGWTLSIMSSLRFSSSCSIFVLSPLALSLRENCTTNLFFLCPKGVLVSKCFLEVVMLPLVLRAETVVSACDVFRLSVGVPRMISFVLSYSSFNNLH